MDNTSASQPSDMCVDGVENFRQGMLSSAADDLMRSIMALDAVHFKAMLDQSRGTASDQEEELRRRQDIIMELESKVSNKFRIIILFVINFISFLQVSVMEVELGSALEERDQARNDAAGSSLAQDDVVLLARQDRDNAVARRTKAEIELAKTRVELMQANGQLLEAIQQKVELSQQLEQWQMDMHDLIEEQMRNKLNENRQRLEATKPREVPAKTPYNRLLSLFQR